MLLQTSGHFLRLVQATAEGVRRYMNAPTGNTSPNSEAEELCRQEIRDYIASAFGKFSTKRRCARTRGVATRSTSQCRIDGARRQRRRECFASERSGGRRRYVEIWDQFLEFVPGPLRRERSRIGPHVHNSPPCCHGLDHAATRTRACELIVKLPWRTIQKRSAKSKWTKTELCLDWHMIAQGVFALSGTLFTTTFNKMVKRSMTA